MPPCAAHKGSCSTMMGHTIQGLLWGQVCLTQALCLSITGTNYLKWGVLSPTACHHNKSRFLNMNIFLGNLESLGKCDRLKICSKHYFWSLFLEENGRLSSVTTSHMFKTQVYTCSPWPGIVDLAPPHLGDLPLHHKKT